MDDRWLSVEEIAAYLGVNRDIVYNWIERKQLPAHKMGRLAVHSNVNRISA
jgi:excisionase family DNA binding protein